MAKDAKAPAQSTLRTYLAMLMQVSRWHLIGVIIATVLCSLSEGIGLALLLPTLQVAGLNLTGQGRAGRYAAIVSRAFLALEHAAVADSAARYFRHAGRRAEPSLSQDPEHVDLRRAAGSPTSHLRRGLYHAAANLRTGCSYAAAAVGFHSCADRSLHLIGSGTGIALDLAGGVTLVILYVAIAFALLPG